MRKAGFTLIELLVVLAIIGAMVSIAVASVTGGRDAAHIRDASRSVVQMSRYATSLALLRQRPVVVTYRRNRVDVQISGDTISEEDIGNPAAPIYMEVEGQEIDQSPLAPQEPTASEPGSGGGKTMDGSAAEKTALFFTRSILDPEELAKEDATREFEDVYFKVEVLGEDGKPLDVDHALSLSLPQPRPPNDRSEDGDEDEDDRRKKRKSKLDDEELEADIPISITYEANGNCTPYRVTVRANGDPEDVDGAVVEISRSGKPQISEEERN